MFLVDFPLLIGAWSQRAAMGRHHSALGDNQYAPWAAPVATQQPKRHNHRPGQLHWGRNEVDRASVIEQLASSVWRT